MKQKPGLVMIADFSVVFLPSFALGYANTSLPATFTDPTSQSITLHASLAMALIYPEQHQTNSKVAEELEQIANMTPNIVDLLSIGQSIQGSDIFCLRITNEENSDPKAGVFFAAHYHTQISEIQMN